VKIGDYYSQWLNLAAGFPQGTWLGPLAFVRLIDNLQPSCETDKFVDDVTLTETLYLLDTPSRMKLFGDELAQWATDNYMIVNYNKTKEMVLGRLRGRPPPALSVSGNSIERVTCFKLLGVHVSNDLRWDKHIQSIATKVNSRLYYLKLLKRAGLSTDELRSFYCTVIRPVLEYACVVWHHGLTQAQCDLLEALQKRALRIIFGQVVIGMPYRYVLQYSNMESLSHRRAALGQTFFDSVCEPDNCLNDLLKSKRSPSVIGRLRHAFKYEVPRNRTDRYCSFINYALANYQK